MEGLRNCSPHVFMLKMLSILWRIQICMETIMKNKTLCPPIGDPRDGRGDVATLPTCGARWQRLSSHICDFVPVLSTRFCPCAEH